jgi:hypothetical protein
VRQNQKRGTTAQSNAPALRENRCANFSTLEGWAVFSRQKMSGQKNERAKKCSGFSENMEIQPQ